MVKRIFLTFDFFSSLQTTRSIFVDSLVAMDFHCNKNTLTFRSLKFSKKKRKFFFEKWWKVFGCYRLLHFSHVSKTVPTTTWRRQKWMNILWSDCTQLRSSLIGLNLENGICVFFRCQKSRLVRVQFSLREVDEYFDKHFLTNFRLQCVLKNEDGWNLRSKKKYYWTKYFIIT